MTKEELFKKYSIDESHSEWEYIDTWMSIEIYRIMHGGELPLSNDKSIKWVVDFLDKSKDDLKWWKDYVMSRSDWGSLYLTAKRNVYKFAEDILKEI